jgi:hypothetical protein
VVAVAGTNLFKFAPVIGAQLADAATGALGITSSAPAYGL